MPARQPMIVRQISTKAKMLYLTFDDGPDLDGTPKVLDILDEHQIKATFFIVASKAEKNLSLAEDILRRGHSIGNHSLDHRYQVFFQAQVKMDDWIQSSQEKLRQLKLQPSVGFRPPNGICTPKLKTALAKQKLPLFLWNVRFYDSSWPWTLKKAQASLKKLQPGSIILLHDAQKPKNLSLFLRTLTFYIREAKNLGFEFDKIKEIP